MEYLVLISFGVVTAVKMGISGSPCDEEVVVALTVPPSFLASAPSVFFFFFPLNIPIREIVFQRGI